MVEIAQTTPTEAPPPETPPAQVPPTQTEVGHEPAQHGKAFPPLDASTFAPQLIWLAITFVALYFIMARLALPRIATVIEERRDRVASDLDQAQQLKRKTEEAIAAYEQALGEARSKAHAIAQDARDKLNAELEQEQAEVGEELAQMTADAETRIQASKAAALSHVNVVAADTAEAIVKALVGGRVTKGEVTEAVGQLMAEMDASDALQS